MGALTSAVPKDPELRFQCSRHGVSELVTFTRGEPGAVLACGCCWRLVSSRFVWSDAKRVGYAWHLRTHARLMRKRSEAWDLEDALNWLRLRLQSGKAKMSMKEIVERIEREASK